MDLERNFCRIQGKGSVAKPMPARGRVCTHECLGWYQRYCTMVRVVEVHNTRHQENNDEIRHCLLPLACWQGASVPREHHVVNELTCIEVLTKTTRSSQLRSAQRRTSATGIRTSVYVHVRKLMCVYQLLMSCAGRTSIANFSSFSWLRIVFREFSYLYPRLLILKRGTRYLIVVSPSWECSYSCCGRGILQ